MKLKSKIQALIPIFVMALLLLPMFLFQNCTQDAGFSGASSDVEEFEVPDPPTNPEPGVTKTLEFRPEAVTPKPLDIVWVIDNSGSMGTESAHVRDNFLDFINFVSANVDLKMAVVSSRGQSGNAVQLPEGLDSDRFIHIEQRVSSRNSFDIVSSFFDSELKDFFRQGSEKAFVFVTDDNADRVSASEFQELFGDEFPGSSFVSYGFVALSAAESPCLARVGSEYMALSQDTGGEVFNICDEDWRPHFSKLADDVVAQTVSEFEIDGGVTVESLLGVQLNGRELLSNEFEILPGLLKVQPSLLVGTGPFLIELEYKTD